MYDREVQPDWQNYPRYIADRTPQAPGEPSLRCADCGETAYELFHGRCAPCAIHASIPLRQKDRDAYMARVQTGIATPVIRHLPPVPPPTPLRWWNWRRWWPWAHRRRATDYVS